MEVVLALGIVSFAMVPLMGLISLAMDTSRTSINTTRQAQIAQRVFADAQSNAWQKDGTTYKFVPSRTVSYFDFDGDELEGSAANSAVYTVNLAQSSVVWPAPASALPPSDIAVKLTANIVSRALPGRVNSLSTVIVRTGL